MKIRKPFMEQWLHPCISSTVGQKCYLVRDNNGALLREGISR